MEIAQVKCPTSHRQALPREAEVVLIGASIAGLYTAYLLARQGKQVHLFDAGELGQAQPRRLIATAELEEVLGFFPEQAVVNRVATIELISATSGIKVGLRKPDVIVERAAMIRLLAQRAIDAGVAFCMEGPNTNSLHSLHRPSFRSPASLSSPNPFALVLPRDPGSRPRMALMPSAHARRHGPFLGCALALVLTLSSAAPAGAVGFAITGTYEDTGEKPQSKLWYNDGAWHAIIKMQGRGLHFYEFDGTTWKPSAFVDAELGAGGQADVKWNGEELFVLAYSESPKLFKYTYDRTLKVFHLVAGFPV